MRTSLFIGALLSAGASSLAGCAFSDGDPWGEAEWSVEARFDEAGRASESGLRTSDDYRVVVEQLNWSVQAVQLAYALGDSVEGFDPSDPPPGYSLCHNGHCHADSGELVDYEDIAAELAAESGQGGAVITQAIETRLAIEASPTVFPLGACSNECRLERGRIATATVQTGELYLVARVTDAREGDAERLNGESLQVELRVNSQLDLQSALDLEIDGRRDPVVHFDASLTIDAGLFDGLQWADETALAAGLASALEDHASLTLSTTRASF